MEAEEWLKEKDLLRRLCSELIVDVLWHPELKQATACTPHHQVTVYRDSGVVHAEVIRTDGA